MGEWHDRPVHVQGQADWPRPQPRVVDPTPQSPGSLLVGDRRRPAAGRAVVAALWAGVVFELFAFGVKELPSTRDAVPWADDPYDVVTSFAIFFVPLLLAVSAVRLPLCRRLEPLPLTRLIGLVRTAVVIEAVALVSLASDWVATVSGSGRVPTAATPIAIGALAVVTAIVVPTAVLVARVARDLPRDRGISGPDAVADLMSISQAVARRLGPAGSPAQSVLAAFDRGVIAAARRRPILATAVAAAVFASLIGATAAAEEGIGPLLGLFFLVAWCGMFAFLAVVGGYVGVVKGAAPLDGLRRRALRATIAACVAVLAALALRDALWWVVGTTADQAAPADLLTLLVAAAALAFVGTLGVETVRERDRSTRPT
jgi:hypothetical protein